MKEVSAGIFMQNNTVLLAQRGKNENLSGYWEFPGGKREKDETIFECLEREIAEELNVRCKAVKIFSESVYEYESGAIKLTAIIADLLDTEIALTVHDNYAWVNTAEILDYKLAPADIPIAKLLLEKAVNLQ